MTMTEGLTVSYGDLALTGTDAFGSVWRVLSPIDGWDGSPGSSIQLTQRPRGAGAFIGPRPQMAARNIVINGLVEALDEDQLQAAIDRLDAAVTVSAQTLSVTRGTATRTITCYRQDEVTVSDVTDVLAEWSVQVTAPDPRKLGTPVVGETSPIVVTGGLSIPFTVPFSIDSDVTGAHTDVTLTNAGIVSGPLTIRIDGPVTGPTVSHINAASVQKVISLPDLVLLAGEYVLIGDADSQYVLINGSAPGDRYLAVRQWFSYEPGANTFSMSVLVDSPDALLTVTATPAY